VAAEQATVNGGRWRSSLLAWAERERGRESLAEGANERGEVGEQGTGLKRGSDARTWPENARTWARPRRGDRGWEVEEELTGGVGETEREAGTRVRGRRRQAWPMGQRERGGREGALVGADRRGPPVRHRGRAGLGLVGRLGLNWFFFFPGIF
jgi:hypothetical protein